MQGLVNACRAPQDHDAENQVGLGDTSGLRGRLWFPVTPCFAREV